MPMTIDPVRTASVHGERTDLALVMEWTLPHPVDLDAASSVLLSAEVVMPGASDLEFQLLVEHGSATGRLLALDPTFTRELQQRRLAFHYDGTTVTVAFPRAWATPFGHPAAIVGTVTVDDGPAIRSAGLLGITHRARIA